MMKVAMSLFITRVVIPGVAVLIGAAIILIANR
jgi:hypothetical protein